MPGSLGEDFVGFLWGVRFEGESSGLKCAVCSFIDLVFEARRV